ncbi:hypothetical protein ASE01_01140 [Nocardioides sp. Root190]|uniref:hypothetical protein n=1 Tax=Nocardioides sp. Root190 TaxID=1736488 RepID=UPI0006FBF739|nr:hypothetical protein [Nocardioides sp. Root190]KRB80136.1 hypothetical protein ASE01_01140 [Nocardioides sp. Root190]
MSDEVPVPPTTPVKIEVTSVTGQKIQFLHKSEKDYYEQAKQKYLDECSFTHANDLRTVDRLLNLEVQCQRYQWYTLAGIHYDATLIEPKAEVEYRRAIKDMQTQIAELQKSLGVTKAEREASTQRADSVGAYITELVQRAKDFGVMRETDKAMELANQLFAMAGAYKRSNENERRKIGLENPETIVDWITDVMQPEYEEIDHHFKKNEDGQKYWIRRL